MKTYPLARRSSIHVYVAETKLVNPDNELFEDVGTSVSRELEYELTGNYSDEEYEEAAKELIEFIRPYSCRHSLNTLFVQLGKKILEDYDKIGNTRPLSNDEQINKGREKFREQYKVLKKFLEEFKQI